MKLQVYAIYDGVAGAFMTPFFMQTDGQAIRAFSDNLNSEDSMLAQHPADFVLYNIGEFDDSTGEIERPLVNKNLGNGLAMKEPRENKAVKIDELIARLEKLIEEKRK